MTNHTEAKPAPTAPSGPTFFGIPWQSPNYEETQFAPWTKWVFLCFAAMCALLLGAPRSRAMPPLGVSDVVAVIIGLSVFFHLARLLHVAEGETSLKIHWRLIRWRRVPWKSIRAAALALDLELPKGYGSRLGPDGVRYYLGTANRGVELTLPKGKRIVVASENPEALLAAIRRRASLDAA
jgi:hypothetical protein